MELRENLVIDLSKKHAIFFDGQNDFIPKRNDCKILDVLFQFILVGKTCKKYLSLLCRLSKLKITVCLFLKHKK